MFKLTDPTIYFSNSQKQGEKKPELPVRTGVHAGANDWSCYNRLMKECDSADESHKLDCAYHAAVVCLDG